MRYHVLYTSSVHERTSIVYREGMGFDAYPIPLTAKQAVKTYREAKKRLPRINKIELVGAD